MEVHCSVQVRVYNRKTAGLLYVACPSSVCRQWLRACNNSNKNDQVALSQLAIYPCPEVKVCLVRVLLRSLPNIIDASLFAYESGAV